MIFASLPKKLSFVTIALGTILTTFYSLPSIAQTNNVVQNKPVENWKLESRTDWNFSSEDESVSVADDLKELREYNISESDLPDVELIKQNGGWRDRLYNRRYTLEAEFYEY